MDELFTFTGGAADDREELLVELDGVPAAGHDGAVDETVTQLLASGGEHRLLGALAPQLAEARVNGAKRDAFDGGAVNHSAQEPLSFRTGEDASPRHPKQAPDPKAGAARARAR